MSFSYLWCLCMSGHSMADSWDLLHRSISWGTGAVLLSWDWIFLLEKVLQTSLPLRKSNLPSSAGLPACSSLQNWALVVWVKPVNLRMAPGTHSLLLYSSVQDILPAFQVVKMSRPSPCPTAFVINDFQRELIWWHSICVPVRKAHTFQRQAYD